MTKRFDWAVLFAGLAALSVSGCGPIPLVTVEKQCLERAQLAQQPRGRVSVGVGSDGKAVGGLTIGISSDYLQGRDPSQVFDSCVFARAGQMPSRPFNTYPPR
jgi:hypothetical protein